MNKLLRVLLLSSFVATALGAPAFKPVGDLSGRYSPVTVSPGAIPLYFPSGSTAGADAPADMKGQAALTLQRLRTNLQDAGLSFEDVAFARAYLAPGADGKVDYEGWNAAWDEVFNNPAKPVEVKPARTTVAVPLLGRPGTLIEIDGNSVRTPLCCRVRSWTGRFGSVVSLSDIACSPSFRPGLVHCTIP